MGPIFLSIMKTHPSDLPSQAGPCLCVFEICVEAPPQIVHGLHSPQTTTKKTKWKTRSFWGKRVNLEKMVKKRVGGNFLGWIACCWISWWKSLRVFYRAYSTFLVWRLHWRCGFGSSLVVLYNKCTVHINRVSFMAFAFLQFDEDISILWVRTLWYPSKS